MKKRVYLKIDDFGNKAFWSELIVMEAEKAHARQPTAQIVKL